MIIPAAIEVRHLSFSYPGAHHRVLEQLDIDIAPGDRVAILGPNGSGKTTFALHLNGIFTAHDGIVKIGGLELTADTVDEIRRRVGLVFQDANDQLFMHTVAEDVAFGPANLGLSRHEIDEKVSAALAAVSAAHLADSTSHHLSGGEKRRAAIATVLSMDPDVLVLDEPTSGLDPVGRHELADLLSTLPQTQVIVTHDLPFALATCTRALVLDGGSIRVDSTVDELLNDDVALKKHRLALPFGYRRVGP